MNNEIPPKYKMVHIQENNKSTEIRDALDNLRYIVTLTSRKCNSVLDDKESYVIKVFNCFYWKWPIEIDRKPNEGELPIYDLSVAEKIYEDYIKVYTSLLKAETRDYQDIDIYALKVGYKRTCPRCCMTCKFSKVKEGKFCKDPLIHLECMNLKNCTEYDFDVARKLDFPKFIPDDHHQIGEPRHYYQKEIHRKHILMHPNVDMFGICMNYEKKS